MFSSLEPRTTHRGREADTARFELFADAVFAIAATLLVTDVHAQARGAGLGRAILHVWPAYAAFAVSFMCIGVLWQHHRSLMRHICPADQTFVSLNIVLLMIVAFFPFPTWLVAEHLNDAGLRDATLLYGATNVAVGPCSCPAGRTRLLTGARWSLNCQRTPSHRSGGSPSPDSKGLGGLMPLALVSSLLSLSLLAAPTIFFLLVAPLFGRVN